MCMCLDVLCITNLFVILVFQTVARTLLTPELINWQVQIGYYEYQDQCLLSRSNQYTSASLLGMNKSGVVTRYLSIM